MRTEKNPNCDAMISYGQLKQADSVVKQGFQAAPRGILNAGDNRQLSARRQRNRRLTFINLNALVN